MNKALSWVLVFALLSVPSFALIIQGDNMLIRDVTYNDNVVVHGSNNITFDNVVFAQNFTVNETNRSIFNNSFFNLSLVANTSFNLTFENNDIYGNISTFLTNDSIFYSNTFFNIVIDDSGYNNSWCFNNSVPNVYNGSVYSGNDPLKGGCNRSVDDIEFIPWLNQSQRYTSWDALDARVYYNLTFEVEASINGLIFGWSAYQDSGLKNPQAYNVTVYQYNFTHSLWIPVANFSKDMSTAGGSCFINETVVLNESLSDGSIQRIMFVFNGTEDDTADVAPGLVTCPWGDDDGILSLGTFYYQSLVPVEALFLQSDDNITIGNYDNNNLSGFLDEVKITRRSADNYLFDYGVGSNNSVLHSPWTKEGDNWYCEATPADDEDPGITQVSNNESVNGPLELSVRFNDTGYTTADSIKCETIPEDSLGLQLDVNVTWFVDDVYVYNETLTGVTDAIINVTLHSDNFSEGQVVLCNVTISDEDDVSATAFNQTNPIGNHPVSFGNATLIADFPNEEARGNLTCHADDVVDLDSDAHIIYNWFRNGEPLYSLYLPFETWSNSTLTQDYSNYSFNGTVNGADWSHDAYGLPNSGAYLFDSGDNITVPNVDQFNLRGVDFALFAWVNTTNGVGREGILTRNDSYGIYLNDSIPVCYVNNLSIIATAGLTLNENHLVVCDINQSAGNLTLYVDGVLNETGVFPLIKFEPGGNPSINNVSDPFEAGNPGTYAYDDDWSTYARARLAESPEYIYFNYSNQSFLNIESWNFTFKYSWGGSANIFVNAWNYSSSSWQTIGSGTVNEFSCQTGAGVEQVRSCGVEPKDFGPNYTNELRIQVYVYSFTSGQRGDFYEANFSIRQDITTNGSDDIIIGDYQGDSFIGSIDEVKIINYLDGGYEHEYGFGANNSVLKQGYLNLTATWQCSVTVVDENSSSYTNFSNIITTYGEVAFLLDGLDSDRSYEIETTANISINATGYEICLSSLSTTGYFLENISCQVGDFLYNYTVPLPILNSFDNFTGTAVISADTYLNLTFHNNYSFAYVNVSFTGNSSDPPSNITFDVDRDGVPEFIILGTVYEDYVIQTLFNETVNKVNVTIPFNPWSSPLIFRMPPNITINNITFIMESTVDVEDLSVEFNFSTLNYINTSNTTATRITGINEQFSLSEFPVSRGGTNDCTVDYISPFIVCPFRGVASNFENSRSYFHIDWSSLDSEYATSITSAYLRFYVGVETEYTSGNPVLSWCNSSDNIEEMSWWNQLGGNSLGTLSGSCSTDFITDTGMSITDFQIKGRTVYANITDWFRKRYVTESKDDAVFVFRSQSEVASSSRNFYSDWYLNAEKFGPYLEVTYPPDDDFTEYYVMRRNFSQVKKIDERVSLPGAESDYQSSANYFAQSWIAQTPNVTGIEVEFIPSGGEFSDTHVLIYTDSSVEPGQSVGSQLMGIMTYSQNKSGYAEYNTSEWFNDFRIGNRYWFVLNITDITSAQMRRINETQFTDERYSDTNQIFGGDPDTGGWSALEDDLYIRINANPYIVGNNYITTETFFELPYDQGQILLEKLDCKRKDTNLQVQYLISFDAGASYTEVPVSNGSFGCLKEFINFDIDYDDIGKQVQMKVNLIGNENHSPAVFQFRPTVTVTKPSDIVFDIGNDGTKDLELLGTLQGPDLISFGEDFLGSLTNLTRNESCGYPLCDIKVFIHSDSEGVVEFRNLQINWSGYNPINLDWNRTVEKHVSLNNFTVFVNFTDGQSFLDVEAEHWGDHNISLMVHPAGTTTYIENRTLNAYGSLFNLTIPGDLWFVGGVTSLTDKNLTPGIFGNPIFNIKPLWTNHWTDFYLKYNGSVSGCIDIMFDNDTVASGARLTNESAWDPVCQNVSSSSYCNISNWVNLDCAGNTNLTLDVVFCTVPICRDCVKTYDWEVCHP